MKSRTQIRDIEYTRALIKCAVNSPEAWGGVAPSSTPSASPRPSGQAANWGAAPAQGPLRASNAAISRAWGAAPAQGPVTTPNAAISRAWGAAPAQGPAAPLRTKSTTFGSPSRWGAAPPNALGTPNSINSPGLSPQYSGGTNRVASGGGSAFKDPNALRAFGGGFADALGNRASTMAHSLFTFGRGAVNRGLGANLGNIATTAGDLMRLAGRDGAAADGMAQVFNDAASAGTSDMLGSLGSYLGLKDNAPTAVDDMRARHRELLPPEMAEYHDYANATSDRAGKAVRDIAVGNLAVRGLSALPGAGGISRLWGAAPEKLKNTAAIATGLPISPTAGVGKMIGSQVLQSQAHRFADTYDKWHAENGTPTNMSGITGWLPAVAVPAAMEQAVPGSFEGVQNLIFGRGPGGLADNANRAAWMSGVAPAAIGTGLSATAARASKARDALAAAFPSVEAWGGPPQPPAPAPQEAPIQWDSNDPGINYNDVAEFTNPLTPQGAPTSPLPQPPVASPATPPAAQSPTAAKPAQPAQKDDPFDDKPGYGQAGGQIGPELPPEFSNATPEQRQQLATELDRFKSGLSPEVQQQAVEAVTNPKSEAAASAINNGAQAFVNPENHPNDPPPNNPQDFGAWTNKKLNEFKSMDPMAQIAMGLGLGVGAIGLISSIAGGGGVGSFLLTALGLGGAAAAGGMFGEAPAKLIQGLVGNAASGLGFNVPTEEKMRAYLQEEAMKGPEQGQAALKKIQEELKGYSWFPAAQKFLTDTDEKNNPNWLYDQALQQATNTVENNGQYQAAQKIPAWARVGARIGSNYLPNGTVPDWLQNAINRSTMSPKQVAEEEMRARGWKRAAADVAVMQKAARCWAGYEPVPGAKAYSKGSCRPKGSKKTQKEVVQGKKHKSK